MSSLSFLPSNSFSADTMCFLHPFQGDLYPNNVSTFEISKQDIFKPALPVLTSLRNWEFIILPKIVHDKHLYACVAQRVYNQTANPNASLDALFYLGFFLNPTEAEEALYKIKLKYLVNSAIPSVSVPWDVPSVYTYLFDKTLATSNTPTQVSPKQSNPNNVLLPYYSNWI